VPTDGGGETVRRERLFDVCFLRFPNDPKRPVATVATVSSRVVVLKNIAIRITHTSTRHDASERHHISYFLASIPSGGCASVVLAPISAQLVESTVPPLSWKLLFIARRVSSSALP